MGRSRKKSESYIGHGYETLPGEKTFTPVFDSMLLTDAFKDLLPRQRMLYIVCKVQTWGHTKPTFKTVDGEDLFSGQEYFFLSWVDVQKYSLYGRANKKYFYDDMKALIEHGFIALVSSGKRQKHKNIYKLDSAWQQWRKPP